MGKSFDEPLLVKTDAWVSVVGPKGCQKEADGATELGIWLEIVLTVVSNNFVMFCSRQLELHVWSWLIADFWDQLWWMKCFYDFVRPIEGTCLGISFDRLRELSWRFRSTVWGNWWLNILDAMSVMLRVEYVMSCEAGTSWRWDFCDDLIWHEQLALAPREPGGDEFGFI